MTSFLALGVGGWLKSHENAGFIFLNILDFGVGYLDFCFIFFPLGVGVSPPSPP